MQTFNEFTNIFGDKNKEMCQRLEDALLKYHSKYEKTLGKPWHVKIKKDKRGRWLIFTVCHKDYSQDELKQLKRMHTIAMREANFVGSVEYKNGSDIPQDLYSIFTTSK